MSTVMITGANRGIGLGLCEQYKKEGADVIAVCRQSSAELDQLGVQVIDQVDIGDPLSFAAFKERIPTLPPIDILINVAGIWRNNNLEDMNFNGMIEQLDINAVGPLQMSLAILPKCHAGSKIAMITSRMGSIADNTSGGRYGYRMSKAALNAGAKSLAIDLKNKDIAVGIFHPGLVQTAMTDFNPEGITVEQSAKWLMQRIHELTLENSGMFYHANGEPLPW